MPKDKTKTQNQNEAGADSAKLDPQTIRNLRAIIGSIGSIGAIIAFAYWYNHLRPWPF